MSDTTIPGYRHGDATLDAPIPLTDLERMKKTALFGEEDERALRAAGEILGPRVEAILDVWYGFVGSQPHLLASFSKPSGPPDAAYLDAVRKRFGQWIRDTTAARYDQRWLDWQIEIGRRHHRMKKNQTDGADASAHIRYVDLIPLVYPIFATVRAFLEEGESDAAKVDASTRYTALTGIFEIIARYANPAADAQS